jgi:hypothetical protein
MLSFVYVILIFWSGSQSVQLSRGGGGIDPPYFMHVSVQDQNFQRNMSWHFVDVQC